MTSVLLEEKILTDPNKNTHHVARLVSPLKNSDYALCIHYTPLLEHGCSPDI
jgi:hypothetical protein